MWESVIPFHQYSEARVIITKYGIIRDQGPVLIVVINGMFYNKYRLFEKLNLAVRFVDLIIRYVMIVLIFGIQSQTDLFATCAYDRLNTFCLSLNSITSSCNAVTMIFRLSTSSLNITTSSSKGDKAMVLVENWDWDWDWVWDWDWDWVWDSDWDWDWVGVGTDSSESSDWDGGDDGSIWVVRSRLSEDWGSSWLSSIWALWKGKGEEERQPEEGTSGEVEFATWRRSLCFGVEGTDIFWKPVR